MFVTPATGVMPREGGASSTPWRQRLDRNFPAYWIVRLRGRWQRV